MNDPQYVNYEKTLSCCKSLTRNKRFAKILRVKAHTLVTMLLPSLYVRVMCNAHINMLVLFSALYSIYRGAHNIYMYLTPSLIQDAKEARWSTFARLSASARSFVCLFQQIGRNSSSGTNI